MQKRPHVGHRAGDRDRPIARAERADRRCRIGADEVERRVGTLPAHQRPHRLRQPQCRLFVRVVVHHAAEHHARIGRRMRGRLKCREVDAVRNHVDLRVGRQVFQARLLALVDDQRRLRMQGRGGLEVGEPVVLTPVDPRLRRARDPRERAPLLGVHVDEVNDGRDMTNRFLEHQPRHARAVGEDDVGPSLGDHRRERRAQIRRVEQRVRQRP